MLVDKCIGTLSPWKFVLIFPSLKIVLVFRYFSLYIGSLSNPFFILLLTLSQILLYFTSNSSSFIKKDFYLVLSKSLQYARILGSIMHDGLTVLPSLQKWILQSFPLTEAIATLIKLIAFCIKSWQQLHTSSWNL